MIDWQHAQVTPEWIVAPFTNTTQPFLSIHKKGYRYVVIHVASTQGIITGRIVELVLPETAQAELASKFALQAVQPFIINQQPVSVSNLTGWVLIYSPIYRYQVGLVYQDGLVQPQRIQLKEVQSKTLISSTQQAQSDPNLPITYLRDNCIQVTTCGTVNGVDAGCITYTVCSDNPPPPPPGSGGGGGGGGPWGGTTGPDKTSVPGMPKTMTMPKQITPGTCVPSSLAQVKLSLCGGGQKPGMVEGEMWKYGIQQYGMDFTNNGVPLNGINSFVSHFFNTTILYPTGNFKGAIEEGYPIMIDVFAYMDGPNTAVYHSVVITGYDPNDASKVYYLDPGTGTTQTGNAATLYANAHYAIPIIGCK